MARLFLVCLSLLAGLAQAAATDTWHWINPRPQGNTLHDLAYDGQRLLAVGDAGTLLTSEDGGRRWQLQTSPTHANLRAALHARGRFLAVGHGAILTSPDGRRWTDRRPETLDGHPFDGRFQLEDLLHHGDRYLIVGQRGDRALDDAGLILLGDPERGWTALYPGTPRLQAIASDGSRLVAVGAAGTLLSSDDGQTWHRQPSPVQADLQGLHWDGRRFIAVGKDGTLLISDDGQAWTQASSPLPPGQHLTALAGDGRRLVAVGRYRHLLSDDGGASWRLLDAEALPEGQNALLWTGARFIAVGHTGRIHSSADGRVWTAHHQGVTGERLQAMAGGGGRLVAVGHAGTLLTSDDGDRWQAHPLDFPPPDLYGLHWDGHRFIAVGTQGYPPAPLVMTSRDGRRWQRHTPAAAGILYAVTRHRDRYLAVGADNDTNPLLLVSDDGTAWHPQSAPGNAPLRAIVSDGARLVAVGDDGIHSSTDGQTWAQQDATPYLTAVAWGGGRFLAVGRTGAVLASDDGRTWTTQATLPAALNAVLWRGEHYLAVGDGGALFTSPDGTSWRARPLRHAPITLNAILHHGDRTWLAGDAAILLSDRPPAPPPPSRRDADRGGFLGALAWPTLALALLAAYARHRRRR